MKKLFLFIVMISLFGMNEASSQWSTNGNNIYNTNSGNVGIGTDNPLGLLYVMKNTGEPMITIRNLGGGGGASYSMIDDGSGADWKFKATITGGFKIRDHANSLDVIVIEPNSFSNALYIKSFGNIGIGTSAPANSALVDMTSTTMGFLPPRMTNAQILAIENPADGLMVYCADCSNDGLGRISIYMAGNWYTLGINNCMNQPSTPLEGTHIPSGYQIIWSWNIVSGATSYKWNVENDYSSASDLGVQTSKTEMGLLPNTSYTRYVWAINPCGISDVLVLTSNTTAWTCGDPIIINHVAGAAAPVNKIATYGTVNNVPGESSKCWITQNLGADHQAIAVNDATEASSGWYWQFNKMQGYKHDGSNRTPNTSWITSITETSNWISSNDPCANELGNNWRIPTKTEWLNVDASGGWSNWNGPWNSLLKMHASGFLFNNDGSVSARGIYNDTWSSTQISDSNGWAIYFSTSACLVDDNFKAYAFTIRCIQE